MVQTSSRPQKTGFNRSWAVRSGFLRSWDFGGPVLVSVHALGGLKTGPDRTFKHYSSHREAGSSTSRVNPANAASHSHLHTSSSMSQCSSAALAVSSFPAPNVNPENLLLLMYWITDLCALSSRSQVLANDRSVEEKPPQWEICWACCTWCSITFISHSIASSPYLESFSGATAFVLVFCIPLISQNLFYTLCITWYVQ